MSARVSIPPECLDVVGDLPPDLSFVERLRTVPRDHFQGGGEVAHRDDPGDGLPIRGGLPLGLGLHCQPGQALAGGQLDAFPGLFERRPDHLGQAQLAAGRDQRGQPGQDAGDPDRQGALLVAVVRELVVVGVAGGDDREHAVAGGGRRGGVGIQAQDSAGLGVEGDPGGPVAADAGPGRGDDGLHEPGRGGGVEGIPASGQDQGPRVGRRLVGRDADRGADDGLLHGGPGAWGIGVPRTCVTDRSPTEYQPKLRLAGRSGLSYALAPRSGVPDPLARVARTAGFL